ncbi:arsenate reductase family protein [Floricoccus penangensis]|uniref:arsenate reductase family protein n=1 Tax=Floricoccus penangensis TaxID=1859475 RepID=UPI00203F6635|nr:arsenate reductase family protein [Floricoccus penangensis]URZ86985.1 arsenate reductase family protein [Floricoccus penangensis]
MYTFYCYSKCSTCKKAKKQLDDAGIKYESIDLKENPPKASLILSWINESGLDKKKFFNTSGIKYRELGLKDKIDKMSDQEAADLLSTDGMLIKRPILLKDGKIVQIGYRSEYNL